jgi:hypothetical protein
MKPSVVAVFVSVEAAKNKPKTGVFSVENWGFFGCVLST